MANVTLADKNQQVRQAASSLNSAISKPKQGGKETLGKEDFLNLLMAQVTHQDPLNPMDSQGMMNQLTSMGSLEQLINVNKGLERLNQVQGDVAQSNAYTFLDKDVTARGGATQVTRGTNPGLHFDMAREADQVKVAITDAGGNPVRTLDMGALGPGRHVLSWDGRDKDGDPVPDGSYRYQVNAKSSDKEEVPVELIMRGKVSAVRFESGRPLLKVNGQEIDSRNIIEISNQSQRLFGSMQPMPPRSSMEPAAPLAERRRQAAGARLGGGQQ